MRTLFDNYNIDYDEMYQCYVECCEENDNEIHDKNSNEFHDWLYQEIDICWDDLMLNINYDDDGKQECVVLGSVGRWYGRIEINAMKFDNLEKAIMACVDKTDFQVITEEKGVVYVTAIHHDSHNSFEIHKLNKKGRNVLNENLLENTHYHAKYKFKF